jgi:hypothetical protein
MMHEAADIGKDVVFGLANRGLVIVPSEPNDQIIEILYGPYLSPPADKVRRKAYRYLIFVMGGGDNG